MAVLTCQAGLIRREATYIRTEEDHSISLGEDREIVTLAIQTLFVVKSPLLTHVKPGVKLHTKAYSGHGFTRTTIAQSGGGGGGG